MHDLDGGAELAQEDGLLHRGVAAAHDHDPPIAEEGGVARGAVRDAGVRELLLARHAELLVLRAHGEDHRARLVLVIVNEHAVRRPVVRELHARGVVADEACTEALRLVAELLHHLRAHHALGETRIVLDVRRRLEQSAPDEALDDQRVQVGPRRVQRRGIARGPASDDDHVLDFGTHIDSVYRRACAVTSLCIVAGEPSSDHR